MCCPGRLTLYVLQWQRPGAEFGGTEKFFTDQDFWMTFFQKNFHFHTQKFLWPFFSCRPGFYYFTFLFPDSPYLYCVKCHIWPFLHKKNHYFRKEFLDDPFFSLFILLRASNNTTYQNIGGMDAWAVPPPQIFLGDRPPSPPRSPPLMPSPSKNHWTRTSRQQLM